MDVLVLQHIACEPPGAFEDVLLERDARLHRVELDEGERLPDWREFGAIVAMGGPMSVNDESDHPWLVAEKRAIGEAVRAGVPYWGACLGVQLLAAALGARVYAGELPEVGVLPVTLTAAGLEDPVFAGLPRELHTLQWHGDTFDLPEGAVLLASSPAYPNQAFRFGRGGLRRPVSRRGVGGDGGGVGGRPRLQGVRRPHPGGGRVGAPDGRVRAAPRPHALAREGDVRGVV